jgi:hypothetical protein
MGLPTDRGLHDQRDRRVRYDVCELLTLISDASGPAVPVASICDDAPTIVAVSVFEPAVFPSVQSIVAAPVAFVVLDAAATVPPPSSTVQLTL